MTVFAIDPGPHTGIFYMKDDKPHHLVFDYRGHASPHEHLYLWLMQMVIPEEDIVLCESFEFRKEDAKNREYIDYSPGELVGVVKLFGQLTGTEYHTPSASTGKGFWDDDKLRRVGLWVGGQDAKHMRDAARHWLHFHTFSPQRDVKVASDWLRRLK